MTPYRTPTRPPFSILFMSLVHMLFPIGYIILVRLYNDQSQMYYEITQYIIDLIPASKENILSLMLSFISGVFLLQPRKLLWVIAMLFLIATASLQFDPHRMDGIFFFQPLAFTPTLTIAFIIFHFRSPYLDRRDHWFYKADRYPTSLPCHVVDCDKIARMVNVSRTGACVQWSVAGLKPKVGSVVEIRLPNQLSFKALVVWESGRLGGVAFQSLSGEQRSRLRELIKKVRGHEVFDQAA